MLSIVLTEEIFLLDLLFQHKLIRGKTLLRNQWKQPNLVLFPNIFKRFKSDGQVSRGY